MAIPRSATAASRRTFARLHVGFGNIDANKAKCPLIAPNRILSEVFGA
jgi:hypothetical protein